MINASARAPGIQRAYRTTINKTLDKGRQIPENEISPGRRR